MEVTKGIPKTYENKNIESGRMENDVPHKQSPNTAVETILIAYKIDLGKKSIIKS